MATTEVSTKRTLVSELKAVTDTPIARCYQCGKCSAGCPMAEEMDLLPHQVIHSILIDRRDRVLTANTPWICASCLMCSARCPMDIDIAAVMDGLRQISFREGRPGQKDIAKFHDRFLRIVRLFGRAFEPMLVMVTPLSLRERIKQLPLGAMLFLKGRMPLLPHRVKNRANVSALFKESGLK